MEQTKVLHALKGVRGREAVDVKVLEGLLVRFSELVVDQPRLREIDINPLVASTAEFLALDARMVLFGPEVGDEDCPVPQFDLIPSVCFALEDEGRE